MQIARIAALALLLPTSAWAQQLQEYRLDMSESIVEFSVRFAFNRVKGRFTKVNGTILYDSLRPERSSVTAIIDAKSLETGHPIRDEHLRTSDLFDVERYPTITFQSQQLTRAGDDWLADGTLTMYGTTRRLAAVRLTFAVPMWKW